MSSINPLEKLTISNAPPSGSFLELLGEMAANTKSPLFIFDGKGVLIKLNKAAANLLPVEVGMAFSAVLANLQLDIAEHVQLHANGCLSLTKRNSVAGTFHEIISGDKKVGILNLFEEPNADDSIAKSSAGNELHLQRAYWRELFESSPEAIAILDREGIVIDVNSEFEKLFGFSGFELIGTDLGASLVQDLYLEESISINKQTLQGAKLEIESFRLHKERYPIEVRILSAPVVSNGEVVAVFGIYQDIRLQKQQEKQLLSSNLRFEEVQRLAKIGNFEYEVSSGSIMFSENLIELFKIPSNMASRSLADFDRLIHEEYIEAFYNAWNKCITNVTEFKKEIGLTLLPGNSTTYISIIGKPELSEKGDVVGIIGTIQDITELKLAEKQLQLLSLVASHTGNAVSILTPNFNVVWVNDGFSKLMGYLPEEVVGLPSQILHEDHIPNLNAALGGLLESKNSATFEIQTITKSGIVIWVQLNVTPVFRGKQLHYWVVVESDITHLKQIQANLQEVNFELDSFVYKASHDLKAPLRSIIGLIDVIEIDFDDQLLHFFLGMLRKSVDKLDSSIVDLLTLSKANRIEVVFEEIDVDEFVNESIESLAYLENFNLIRIEIENRCQVAVFSDRFLLSTILNNLLSNAIKYHNTNQTDPLIQICVSTEADATLKIEVKDNGQGIPDEVLPRIFEMFYRGSERSFGTGLGLYIVQNIVKKLGGKITVGSVLGKSTYFVVLLPLKLHQKETNQE